MKQMYKGFPKDIENIMSDNLLCPKAENKWVGKIAIISIKSNNCSKKGVIR